MRLGDGSTAKIPRRWTDVDGTMQCVELGGDSRFSLSLRELLKSRRSAARRFPLIRASLGFLFYLVDYSSETLIADEQTVYDPELSD